MPSPPGRHSHWTNPVQWQCRQGFPPPEAKPARHIPDGETQDGTGIKISKPGEHFPPGRPIDVQAAARHYSGIRLQCRRIEAFPVIPGFFPVDGKNRHPSARWLPRHAQDIPETPEYRRFPSLVFRGGEWRAPAHSTPRLMLPPGRRFHPGCHHPPPGCLKSGTGRFNKVGTSLARLYASLYVGMMMVVFNTSYPANVRSFPFNSSMER